MPCRLFDVSANYGIYIYIYNAVVLSAKATEFQLKLTNKFKVLEQEGTDVLDRWCDDITTTIMETAVEIAGTDKQPRPDKLSTETKQLREKCCGIGIEHIEYTETCKAIRHRLKEEIRSYDEEQQLKALENSKGLKSTKRKQCLGRNNIITLKEEDGKLIEDLDRMVKRCDEFYTNLYSTRQPLEQHPSIVHTRKDTQPAPPILPSESGSCFQEIKAGYSTWGRWHSSRHLAGWRRAHCQDTHRVV